MKNTFSKLLVFMGLMVIAASCTTPIKVDVGEEKNRMVIEGLVTTETRPFQVKLSMTQALGTTGDYPLVNNGLVIISDDIGNVDTLVLVGPGIYKTVANKTGVVGRTYYLTVKVDGQTYFGYDKIHKVSKVDSIYTKYKEAGSSVGITKDGYYAYINYSDPQNEKNYYMYKMYKNGTTVLSPSEVVVYDDRFLSAVITEDRLEGRYALGDKIELQLYSLSESGFQFYFGLASQLQSDGGFFNTPPANPTNNLTNGALGFFQASDIQRKTVEVK